MTDTYTIDLRFIKAPIFVHHPFSENVLHSALRTFWSLSSHDITGTLDKVIERVLKDASISAESRCDRLGLRADER